MFSLDRWQEIYAVLSAHKLRTSLTALSIAWGIFMLVVLLGAGNGLQGGVESEFKDDATNALWVYAGKTSKPHNGRGPGRRIQLRNSDFDYLRNSIPEIEHITSRFYLPGRNTVRYRDKTSGFEVRATHPDHRLLENTIMTVGRFLNPTDIRERRKVAVIGTLVANFLFGNAKSPIGEHIMVNDVAFRVVGIFEDKGSEGEQRIVYIPVSTAQRAFGGRDHVNQIMFTVAPGTGGDEARAIERRVRSSMALRHDFAPNDRSAMRVRNMVERFESINAIFTALQVFIWVIGIGTVLAGIVGVSNIMLISVRERTVEIGLRKALGATPGSIVAMIVQEGLVVTLVSGYAGLVAGVGVVWALRTYIPKGDFFANPTVELPTALVALGLLGLAGIIAGYFPARRAAQVEPVVVLREG